MYFDDNTEYAAEAVSNALGERLLHFGIDSLIEFSVWSQDGRTMVCVEVDVKDEILYQTCLALDIPYVHGKKNHGCIEYYTFTEPLSDVDYKIRVATVLPESHNGSVVKPVSFFA